jgi:SAM-dependent methyltransferase
MVFGRVAALYDDVRPGYPDAVLDAIVSFHGGPPRSVIEPGAGTGKGTELLVRLGVPITCVEPDPRMAAVLVQKFPQVTVANERFEEWRGKPADLVACALSWHWLDPATRDRRCRDALTAGGTLAILRHTYGYADPAVEAAVMRVLLDVDPTVRPRGDDALAAVVWSDVEEHEWHSGPEFTRAQFLQLMQTFGPFLRRSPAQRQAVLTGLDEILPSRVTLDLRTTLVLAR